MQSVRCALQNNWNFRKINKEIVVQTKNRKNYKKIKNKKRKYKRPTWLEFNLENIFNLIIFFFF